MQASDIQKVVTSSIVIVPPEHLCGQIQDIRRLYDKSFERWMPHINLLYPFMPKNQFASVVGKIQTILKEIKPFKVRLDQFTHFEHRASTTVFLDPKVVSEDKNAINGLQSALQNAFPFCDDLSTKAESGFHAHMSLANFQDVKTTLEKVAEFNAQFKPVEFEVNSIHLIARIGELPFKEIYTIDFGSDNKIVHHVDNDNEIRERKKLAKKQFSRLPTYKFNNNKWSHIIDVDVDQKKLAATNVNANQLTVVSYNVLFDIYDQEKIYTKERIPKIFEELKNTNADIIGLEEMTPTFVRALLSQDWVRQHYYVSDNGSCDSLSEKYGQVLLSKFPFDVYFYVYSAQKRAVIAEFLINKRKVFLPVIHLTSERNADIQKRVLQMGVVYDRVCSDEDFQVDDGTDCIMIGDFNIADGDSGEEYAFRSDFSDSWRDIHPNDPGYTYDPEVNTLAKITTEMGLRRRLDRILLRSHHWVAKTVEIFGNQSFEIEDNKKKITLFPSDHYGVKTVIEFNAEGVHKNAASSETANNNVEGEKGYYEENPGKDDLKEYLEPFGLFESPEVDQRRSETVKKIESLIASHFIKDEEHTTPFLLLTMGSYHLGVHSPGSDMDLLCVSNLDSESFFKFASRALNAVDQGCRVLQLLTDALIPVLKLKVNGFSIDLQYCRVLKNMQDKHFSINAIDDKDQRKMDMTSVQTLNGHRDGEVILKCLATADGKKLARFRIVHQCIKLWAKRKGLYNNRLGYFGGFGWTILVLKVVQLYPKLQPRQLVHKFFQVFSHWDWSNVPVAVTLDNGVTPSYKMDQQRDRMAIVTLSKPYKNSARNVTKSSRRVLINAFTEAELITREQDWSTLFHPTPFVTSHKAYLNIVISAILKEEYFQWVGFVESRLIDLCIKIENRAPNLIVHLWPVRYINQSDNYPYSCCYFIGFTPRQDQAVNNNTNEQNNAGGQEKKPKVDFTGAVLDFQHLVNGWEKKTLGMDLSIKQLTPAKIAGLKLVEETTIDDFEGGDREAEDSEYSSSNTNVAANTNNNTNANNNNVNVAHGGAKAQTPADKKKDDKGGKKKTNTKEKESEITKKRLHTSEEVYNRVKWDSRYNSAEFVIVYEDRFKGLVEIPFEDFRDNADEVESVPFHRVWYFKHNGKVVWDRKERMDLIFDD
jgi:poly(A) polymerase Pap1/uncharacterized protein (UPF0248 family)/2'-5' RNA ligase/endonuclease/exonuclease/phosphatase family metal-dependent hydrolase